MNGLHLWLIPILPLAGFLLNGLLGHRLPKALVSTNALLFTAAPFLLVLHVYTSFSALSLPYVERHSAWIATSASSILSPSWRLSPSSIAAAYRVRQSCRVGSLISISTNSRVCEFAV